MTTTEKACYNLGHARASLWMDSCLVTINIVVAIMFSEFAFLNFLCVILFGTKCISDYIEIRSLKEKFQINEQELKEPL